jgi:hypothetical protein
MSRRPPLEDWKRIPRKLRVAALQELKYLEDELMMRGADPAITRKDGLLSSDVSWAVAVVIDELDHAARGRVD